MSLDFTNNDYFIKACQFRKTKDNDKLLSKEDAFLILIKDLKPEQLDNLTELFAREGEENTDFSALNENEKNRLYQCALELLEKKKPLGSETINNGKTNTSDWISHSLGEGRLCAVLAEKMNLDPQRAEVMGMLHDYGRKEIHSIQHVIRGFELLSDMGYDREAISCLTHSFINGGRCASNEIAEDGFYVSPDGIPCWSEGSKKDDVTRFLEQYEYDDYDRILNLADLMASSHGILSPYDRILDIATRRTIDPTNRGYFLAELLRLIAWCSDKMELGLCTEEYSDIYFDNGKQTDYLMQLLKKVSDEFFDCIKTIL